MAHAETLLQSCLAVAEFRMNDEKGIHWTTFMERLTASIASDSEAMVPEFLGYNEDGSDFTQQYTRSGRWWNREDTRVTYNGVQY
jgi:hypothetical protein